MSRRQLVSRRLNQRSNADSGWATNCLCYADPIIQRSQPASHGVKCVRNSLNPLYSPFWHWYCIYYLSGQPRKSKSITARCRWLGPTKKHRDITHSRFKGGYVMSRKYTFGLAAAAVIGLSLAMSSPAHANGSHGSRGGDSLAAAARQQRRQLRRPVPSPPRLLRQLWLTRRGSSNSSSCDCDCNGSDEASEGHHNDNNARSTATTVMESPSRERWYRDSRVDRVYERDRDGRRTESTATTKTRTTIATAIRRKTRI